MDKEKIETAKEEPSTEDTGEGDKPESTALIDGANKAAERLEAANKKQEELLNKQEELMARQALGGRTEAGGEAKKEEPLSDREYADKVKRGEANPFKDDGIIK